MSSDSPGEKPGCRKSKVSCATLIGAGLVGSNLSPELVRGMYKTLIFVYFFECVITLPVTRFDYPILLYAGLSCKSLGEQ